MTAAADPAGGHDPYEFDLVAAEREAEVAAVLAAEVAWARRVARRRARLARLGVLLRAAVRKLLLLAAAAVWGAVVARLGHR